MNTENSETDRSFCLKFFNKSWQLGLLVTLFSFGFFLAFANTVSAQTPIYRSVGPSQTQALASGTSNAMTISGTTATFASALPEILGNQVAVGDVIQYDSDGNGTIDSVAFIHAKISATEFTVANAAGGTPTAVTGDNDWSIFRAYTSLFNAEAGTENTGIHADVRNFDTWTGGRDLVTNNERWTIMAYGRGAVADTTAVTITDWTTSATNYLEIIGDNRTGWYSEQHYRIEISSSGQVIDVQQAYVRLKYLQVKNSGNNTSNGGFRSINYPGQQWTGLVAWKGSGEASGAGISLQHNIDVGDHSTVTNSVIIGRWGTDGFVGALYVRGESANSQVSAYNILIVGAYDGVRQRGSFSRIYNSAIINSINTSFHPSSGSSGLSYNAWNVGSGLGTNNVDLTSADLNNVFVDYTRNDYAIKASSPLAAAGIDLSSDNYTYPLDQDYFEKIRPSTPSIGPFEPVKYIYRSVGPGATGNLSTGASNALTISGTTATFASALLPAYVKVGDAIQYDSDDNGTIDAIAFIHERISSTEFVVANAAGGTPTAVTADNDWVIYRAYTSLANAENGTENTNIHANVRNFDTWTDGRDLVANNERWVIMAYANGTTADTSATISGWTTGRHHFLEIIGDNNTGAWSDNHYKIAASAAFSRPFIVTNPYVRVSRLQVQNTASNGWGGFAVTTPTSFDDSYYIGNIVRNSLNNQAGFVLQSGSAIYANNISYGNTGAGFHHDWGNSWPNVKFINNVSYGNGGAGFSFNSTFQTTRLYQNNYSGGNTGDDYAITGTRITNASEDATGDSGLTSISPTAALTDPANGDFSLLTNSPLIDVGTTYDLVSTDIIGNNRPQGSAWDIGAFEYDASGPTAIYRSVGPSATSALATGASNALTISGSTATFGSALPDNVRVGDAIQYDSDGNSTIDAIAFIHARTNSTTFTVANAAGGTPTAVTGDNDWSIFRAYTSLANAEDGTENTGIDAGVRNFDTWTGGRDLVANNERWVIMAYANGTTADTTRVFIQDWVTSETNDLEIVGDNNTGIWNDDYYRIVTTNMGDGDGVITVLQSYVYLRNLQIETPSTGAIRGIRQGDSESITGLRISHNIIRGPTGASHGITGRAGKVQIWNNVIIGWHHGIVFFNAFSGAESIAYNNTIIGSRDYGIHVYTPLQNPTLRLKNNIVQDAGVASYGIGFEGNPNVTTDYASNISSDNSSPNASFRNLTVAFVDANNGDYRLSSSDTSALDTGTNLSADPNLAFNTDIKGVTRPQGSEWDIGAHEGAVVILPTISGVIYIDEGQTTIGADRTVRVKVNGAGEYSGLTNSSGQYSINDVTISSAGDIVTVFLDGATEKAVTVTRATDTSSNITGLNLYQNFVIVRHEDAGPITNTNLDQYDSGGDADIQFTVTGGNITVSSGNTLLVAGGKTYAPGGNITTPSLEVVGTLNSGANTLELSDSLGVSGSLTGSGNVTVSGGSATGDGAINLSGGTFLIDGDGNFGGNGNWAFNNLTFGDGSGFATTTASGSGPVTVEGIMTIATNQTLEAGSKTWNLHGSPAGGGGPSSLLLYVNFEEGPPAQSPYVLGATEHSAGSSNVELEFTFGGAINATGATVGNYGVQFGGFGSSIEIPVSNGDIFNKNIGRVGFWIRPAPSDDIIIFNPIGSDLDLVLRSNGNLRMRWNAQVIINSSDWSEYTPLDRTPTFIEAKWDRANNLRAIRMSTDTTEGTWRTNTDSWTEPSDATAVNLGGQYGGVYSDNWFISEDPDENLWELRNMQSYAEYGGSAGAAPFVTGESSTVNTNTSTITFQGVGSYLLPNLNYYNLRINQSGDTLTASTTFSVANNLEIVAGTLDLDTHDPVVTIPGNLTIGDTLIASATANLNVQGNFTNNGTFTHNNGTLIFSGAGTSDISSSTSTPLYNITSTTAGKTLRFGTGRTFPILGTLTLTGTEGNPISLESINSGVQWIVNFINEQSAITHTSIRDAGCIPSSALVTLGTGMTNVSNNATCWFRLSSGAIIRFGGGGATSGGSSGSGAPTTGGDQSGGEATEDEEGGASGGGTGQTGGGSGGGGGQSP